MAALCMQKLSGTMSLWMIKSWASKLEMSLESWKLPTKTGGGEEMRTKKPGFQLVLSGLVTLLLLHHWYIFEVLVVEHDADHGVKSKRRSRSSASLHPNTRDVIPSDFPHYNAVEDHTLRSSSSSLLPLYGPFVVKEISQVEMRTVENSARSAYKENSSLWETGASCAVCCWLLILQGFLGKIA